MDQSFNKFVNYINKNKIVSIDDLETKFKLSPYEAYEIIQTLHKNKYIIALGDNEYQATYKSKTYKKSSFLTWLYNNWLSIIAIIISIIALFK